MPGIDELLLNFTERLCQRFQKLTGRTNVWLAVQLTNLSIIIYFFSAAIYFPAVQLLGARIAVALFCGGVLYVLTQTVFKESIKLAESSAYARVAKGLRNPRRLRDAPLRISFLTMSGPDAVSARVHLHGDARLRGVAELLVDHADDGYCSMSSRAIRCHRALAGSRCG